MNEIVVQMKGITKEFPGVKALRSVDLNIYKGKVMALVGENGAGKSTLMKILTGAYPMTSGEISFMGKSVKLNSPKEAQTMGIAMIHQELNMVGHLSIAENIFLGREPVNSLGKIEWKKLYKDAQIILDRLGIAERPDTLAEELSIGKQQMVEIAKALSIDAQIIIMDEPTGALADREAESLFRIIQELKEEGRSIVYISHRLKEIFRVCDDITVLRDGEFIGEYTVGEIDEDRVIELMVGRKLSEQYPRIISEPGNILLEIRNLNNEFVKDISFSVRKGEILGISGLMGSGRTELARTIYGIYPKSGGDILLDGKSVTIHSPGQAIDNGIAYVSEDRKTNGVVLGLNISENISLSILEKLTGLFGRVNTQKEEAAALESVHSMSIKAPSIRQLVRNLSGGNQQKVSLAKSIATEPKVLILDEPTRGVDVGAKKEIYDIMNKFKMAGMCIIMISSEIPEILGMSDRILVMSEGRVTGCLEQEQASQESIMRLAVNQRGGTV